MPLLTNFLIILNKHTNKAIKKFMPQDVNKIHKRFENLEINHVDLMNFYNHIGTKNDGSEWWSKASKTQYFENMLKLGNNTPKSIGQPKMRCDRTWRTSTRPVFNLNGTYKNFNAVKSEMKRRGVTTWFDKYQYGSVRVHPQDACTKSVERGNYGPGPIHVPYIASFLDVSAMKNTNKGKGKK